jgi:hypothetical protein
MSELTMAGAPLDQDMTAGLENRLAKLMRDMGWRPIKARVIT